MPLTTTVDQIDMKNAALSIAQSAADEAMQFFRNPLGIEFKADESPVTIADRAVESAVRAKIARHFPDHGIFGEEHGITQGAGDDMWIVDPIDGTRSFITGHPLFGFLLAKLTAGQPDLAIIGMPALSEVYVAQRGQGVTLNDQRLMGSGARSTKDCTIYINEGEKIWRQSPDLFERLMACGRTRRFSYDCYPYALLAAGHIDVVIDADLQPYDYLPVSLIVEEAGGTMTNWSGAPLGMEHNVNSVAAATPELHAKILDILQAGT